MADARRASRIGAPLPRWLVAVSTGACIAVGASRANAEELPEPIHLRFDVDGELANQCPPQAQFMELLRAELPRLTLAPDDARARTFDVRIRCAGASLRGEVVVASMRGASYTRSVDARDRATLTRALVVVAALASNAVPEKPSSDDAPTVPDGDSGRRAGTGDERNESTSAGARPESTRHAAQDEPRADGQKRACGVDDRPRPRDRPRAPAQKG